jgi:hypothetical protein
MITTFAWFGYELPKETCFDLIKQAGFDGVTLWWNNDFGDNNFRNNPVLARNAGLFIENIHTPFEDINNPLTRGERGRFNSETLTEIS